jgi:hypothetical protein
VGTRRKKVVVPRKPRTKRTNVQKRQRQRCASHPRSTLPSFLYGHSITKERTEVDKWADGAKSSKSKQDKEEKRKAELERKAENARLLAEEEASQALRAKKAAAKASPKKGKPKPAGPGAIAAEGDPSDPNLATEESSGKSADGPQEVESFAATGIDNALDLLEVVTAKMDKASIGNQAAGIEKHPEVCSFTFLISSSPVSDQTGRILQRRFKVRHLR